MSAFGRIAPGALIAVLLCSSSAHGATAAAKCEAAKIKIAGKYAMCRLNAHSKSVKAPVDGKLSLDLDKCAATFTDKWTKAEEKGGADCPTSGDASTVDAAITHVTGDFSLVFSSTRFIDNLDGTITDLRSGLMWEKKDSGNGAANLDDIHDADNTYQWSSTGTLPDGSVFTDFLGHLNTCITGDLIGMEGSGFAGHCDWRLPTFSELFALHIEDPIECYLAPACIDPAFLPTGLSSTDELPPRYWTSISDANNVAGTVSFSDYSSAFLLKTTNNYVRAVRTIGGPFIMQ